MKKVKFKGNPLNLIGIIPCDTAPDFVVVSSDMKEVRLSDYYGKIKVINSFPSLDTPVCDLQLKEFNKIATGLSEDVIVIGVSVDIPFAQKRFCEQNKMFANNKLIVNISGGQQPESALRDLFERIVY